MRLRRKRYFGGERRVKARRILRQALCAGGDFIPMPEEEEREAKEKEEEEEKTEEDCEKERLNKCVRENPNDVEAWIELSRLTVSKCPLVPAIEMRFLLIEFDHFPPLASGSWLVSKVSCVSSYYWRGAADANKRMCFLLCLIYTPFS